jgi:protein-S-isoprenylcysteine O-methyltransferase Ste14
MALQEEFENNGIWLFRYRSTLPLAILLVGFIVYIKGVYFAEMPFQHHFLTERIFTYFCLLISLLGLLIRVYTVGHSASNTSGRNTKEQVADSLNTSGIYSVVRHPLYLGNLLMWLGPALLTQNLWFVVAFCLFYWVYYERIMFAEEQYLRRKFGEPYLEWAGGVPAFLPRFTSFRKPHLPLNLNKVLRKEKNGLAAVFLVFSMFDIAGKLVQGRLDYDFFLIYATIGSLLIYLLVKIFKNKLTY